MNYYRDCNSYTTSKGCKTRNDNCHYNHREECRGSAGRDKCESCCKCKKCCPGPVGPRGPRGPKGEATIILGSYNSLAELTAAHPTGEVGDAYLVGGELYIWDDENGQWKSVGNLTGPTGPQGEATTILGSYNTLAELTAAHPTGEVGDAYLVGSELYVWDAENGQWKSVGNLTGPTGPTGPQGEATTILGSYDSLAELIADHPTGEVGDAYLVGGELYVWDDENKEWKFVGDLTGPTGPQGVATTILGSYDTLAELKNDHPTGNRGDAYLVDGVLYVWNPETNDWEAVGDLRGPKGSTNTIIPFSSGTAAALNSSATGARDEVVQIGYGDHFAISAALDPITIHTLEGDKHLTFSMPDDGVITAISIFMSVAGAAVENAKITFKLYSSAIPDNTFYPLNDTLIEFEVPALAAIGTMYHHNLTDLNIPVTVNTRIMLIGYCESEDVALQALTFMHVTGSIKIESEN